jgi:DNA-binding transcriptional regulator YiaG
MPETLGDHLRKRRYERGLLQEAAADRLGVNTWTLGNWEKGHTKPALRLWPSIIEFLGYDPESEPEGLGQRIEWARRREGLSIRELARKLGVDPETLRRWERGIRIPRGRWLDSVEEFLRGR